MTRQLDPDDGNQKCGAALQNKESERFATWIKNNHHKEERLL
jgi:hypothetical protein